MEYDFDITHDNMGTILDWRLQYENVKPLLVIGTDETIRADLMKKFGRNYFDNTIFTNLKNNAEIRNYINDNEPGRDMFFFLEKTLADMIVPDETLLIFNNAQTCDGIWPLLKYVYELDNNIYFAATGDFTEEQLTAASDFTMQIRL